MKKQSIKTLLFDIEATNLNANFGFILCIGYKWLDEKKVHILSINDFPAYERDKTSDRGLVKEFSRIYNSAQVVVGHYSTRFDTPYINARLLYHNLPPLGPVRHIDTWRISRDKLRLNSNRLNTIGEFFEFPSKTPVHGPHWVRATAGNPRSLHYIERHCIRDIEVLEATYLKLRGLMQNHPSQALITSVEDGCPTCGDTHLSPRGSLLSQVGIAKRFRCPQGHWCHTPYKTMRGTLR